MENVYLITLRSCLRTAFAVLLIAISSSAFGQGLTITKTDNATNVMIGSVVTYTITVTNDGTADMNVVIADAAPTNTTLVPGSPTHISGVAPVIPNPATPNWTIATLVANASTTVRFQVGVNGGIQPQQITNIATVFSDQTGAINSNPTSFTVVPQIANTACLCLNDASVNMLNGSYSTALIIKNPDNTPLSPGQTFNISSASGLYTPDGDAGPGVQGAPINNGPFTFCNGVGCPAGVSAGQYYREAHIPTNGNFNLIVSSPAGGTSSYSQTGCESYPPLPNIPLMNLECLTGVTSFSSSGGTYSAFDAFDDPNNNVLFEGFSQVGTGNLSIDPALLNSTELPYTIYLMKEVDGCQSVRSKEDFSVYKSPVAELMDFTYECKIPGQTVILTDLFTANTTPGGNYTVDGVSLGAGVATYVINTPGCHTMIYEATHPACPSDFDNANFFVSLTPDPDFTISSDKPSPVCLYGVASHIVTIKRMSSGFNPILTVSPNTGFTIDGNIATEDVTIEFATPMGGTSANYSICLEERVSLVGCSGFSPTKECKQTFCRNFVVYNDGYSCGQFNLFSKCPETFKPDPCEIDVSPALVFVCMPPSPPPRAAPRMPKITEK